MHTCKVSTLGNHIATGSNHFLNRYKIVEKPRTCGNIKCDPGEVCRFRDRGPNLHPIVRCVEVGEQAPY